MQQKIDEIKYKNNLDTVFPNSSSINNELKHNVTHHVKIHPLRSVSSDEVQPESYLIGFGVVCLVLGWCILVPIHIQVALFLLMIGTVICGLMLLKRIFSQYSKSHSNIWKFFRLILFEW